MNVTTRNLLGGLLAAAALAAATPGVAEVKKVAYPEVKVTLEKPYTPDAAFEKMHAAFLDAVKRKDLAALTALVAPTFLWTVSDQPADELDLGRDAIHNFKVAFGFRALGQDVDGGVDNGPYWEVLGSFAEDTSYYVANDAGTLVCGPVAAEVADDKVLDQARRKIDAINEPVEWYFTLAETSVARAPGDTGDAGRQGRDHRAAADRLLSAREGRRAAAAADPFRGAAAVRPHRLGAGLGRAPARDRPPLLRPHAGRRVEDRRHRPGDERAVSADEHTPCTSSFVYAAGAGAWGITHARSERTSIRRPTTRLEKAGYLASHWTTAELGRKRRVYKMTRRGERALSDHRALWQRFVDAIGGLFGEKAGVPARTHS